MAYPLGELTGPISALFCDLDGTLTHGTQLRSQTITALERLLERGLPVILVTGRPSGWGHTLANLLRFSAVIAENGGVRFLPRQGALEKRLAFDAGSLQVWREKMFDCVAKLLVKHPKLRLSSDSAFREVDLAIDWNEEVKVEQAIADEAVNYLREQGLAASRSSVHVNFGPPHIDKWSATQQLLAECFQNLAIQNMVYVGDSLNDTTMFGGIAKSVGVANVKNIWHDLSEKPKYLTAQAEDQGFAELAKHLESLL